jgi:gustatory receptor
MNKNFRFSFLPFPIDEIYFWFSLLFLISRTSLMILTASQIPISARYPLTVFRLIPTETWNEELQRFFNQIKTHTNALTALGFFCLTRKLLLGFVGALLTYELVLLQFDASAIDHLVNCDAFEMP